MFSSLKSGASIRLDGLEHLRRLVVHSRMGHFICSVPCIFSVAQPIRPLWLRMRNPCWFLYLQYGFVRGAPFALVPHAMMLSSTIKGTIGNYGQRLHSDSKTRSDANDISIRLRRARSRHQSVIETGRCGLKLGTTVILAPFITTGTK